MVKRCTFAWRRAGGGGRGRGGRDGRGRGTRARRGLLHGRAGGSLLVALEHGAAAALRCTAVASLPARQRRRPAWSFLAETTYCFYYLPRSSSCSGRGAGRAAWRRLPDNASSSSRRPRAVPERERERERTELPRLGALPRELKRNAPCFSLFPRLLARPKREREREKRGERQEEDDVLYDYSLQLSSSARAASVVSDVLYRNL